MVTAIPSLGPPPSAEPAGAPAPVVSVIVPTYHRPELIRRAVASLLRQELPGGEPFEVVVVVSDRNHAPDRTTAHELAAADPRVRVALADRLGPAAARNAGMAAARAPLFAFMDDDCEAEPGWLAAGLERLDEFDVVQGVTRPATPWTEPFAKSLTVSQLSYLWETCNLFVRRSAVEKAGGFDEDWNPTGVPGKHWGEDTEWGWRLVRHGARYTFVPEAVVLHGVFPRSYGDWLDYELQVRYFPLILRHYPELRRRFHRGYFLSSRHEHVAAGAGMLAAAGVVRLLGGRRLARGMALAGAVPVFSPWRFKLYEAVEFTMHEAMVFGALVYGSVRHRRILL